MDSWRLHLWAYFQSHCLRALLVSHFDQGCSLKPFYWSLGWQFKTVYDPLASPSYWLESLCHGANWFSPTQLFASIECDTNRIPPWNRPCQKSWPPIWRFLSKLWWRVPCSTKFAKMWTDVTSQPSHSAIGSYNSCVVCTWWPSWYCTPSCERIDL